MFNKYELVCAEKITDNAAAFANEVRFLNKGEEDEMVSYKILLR